MPLTSGSVSTHLDGVLGLRHAILGTIEVNGWKLWKQKHRTHDGNNKESNKMWERGRWRPNKGNEFFSQTNNYHGSQANVVSQDLNIFDLKHLFSLT